MSVQVPTELYRDFIKWLIATTAEKDKERNFPKYREPREPSKKLK
jgi:hypothetical protein